MFKPILFLSFWLCPFLVHGQIYVDPTTASAMAIHSGLINSGLNQTSENLTLVQRAQLAVTGELVILNDLQSTIYKGLSEVSSVVRSLLSVQDIYEISEDIVTDVNRAIDIAASSPELLLFAEAGANEFKDRSVKLAAEVSSFVLAGGIDNLMDSGERAKLLNRIVTELSIIRGVAYGLYKSMYWAQQRGFFNSINPYSGYINIDKNLVDNVVSNSKLFKP